MAVEHLLIAKLVIVGFWFAVLFMAERLAAAARAPQSKARLFRNGGLWLIILMCSPLIVAPLSAWGANELIWSRPELIQTGLWGAVLLTVNLALLDLWTYGVHRTYHLSPALWRIHEVHHRDEFLDTTSAFRFHLAEVALSAALRLIPIMALAIPLAHVIIFETLLLCATLFHHSNIRLPARLEAGLSRIIVTPSIHWVHHHALQKDTDSNYATILSVWDRAFGTRNSAERQIDMKIGVESVEDKPLLGLILMPFMRRRA